MADIGLKPCPFCGGSVRFDKAYSYFRDSVIYCDDCDMVFTLDDCQASDDEICEAWNRRADDTDTAEWIYKEVRGTMTNVCSVCGSCSVYPDKYCGGCGRGMKNGC